MCVIYRWYRVVFCSIGTAIIILQSLDHILLKTDINSLFSNRMELDQAMDAQNTSYSGPANFNFICFKFNFDVNPYLIPSHALFYYNLFQSLRMGILLLLPAGLHILITQGPATYPNDQHHHLPVHYEHPLPAHHY